ncbi:MAG: response regulator [Oscillatoriales cyanobacterium SM2_1_8]|nr:response regulator [Oscillatoriales cyanobacterium SM2_1_8]
MNGEKKRYVLRQPRTSRKTLARWWDRHRGLAARVADLTAHTQTLEAELEALAEGRAVPIAAALERELVLSDCLALAIAQKQAWAETLNEVGTTPPLPQILKWAVGELQEGLECDRALAFQGTEAERDLVAEALASGVPSLNSLPAACGFWCRQQQAGTAVPLLPGVAPITLLGEAILELVDVVNDIGDETLRACASIQVHLPGSPWVALVVQQTRTPRYWSAGDLRFLLQVGLQVGLALQQESWLERTRQRTQQSQTALMAEWQRQLERVAIEAGREQAIAGVLDRIRRSLSLAEIFQTTATEARRILNCDRVAMFRFEPASYYAAGEMVSESVGAPYRSALHQPVADHCFADRRLDDYLNGRVWSVADIETTPMADCYRAILQQFEVRANLVVPLLNGTELWGLFCAHQCGGARTWEVTDIDFVQRLAAQLSVALQQATLLEQAEAARQAADRASRAKGEFLASMSHELRTPLNAILGLSQLLQVEANLTNRQREWLSTIHESGDHLLSLIGDVLEMSKIEAGKLSIEETCFELSGALEGLLDLMAVKNLSKRLMLSYQPALNLPRFVQTDRKKLSQILLNLLSNAIKFTERGKVVLRVQQERLPDPSVCWLDFAVEDTGIGISEGSLDSIFQPFERGDERAKRYEGTGLGLAIARRFVELMGGQLTVQSQAGKGTTFRFRILVKTPSRLPEPEVGAPGLLPSTEAQPWVRVLVVEDHAANREVLRSMLQALGYRFDVVASGAEALARLAQHSYEIVLMDVQMPEMDGLETTRRIYQELPVERHPLILAVTAGVLPEEKQKCLAVGMCDFLAKPVRLEALQEMLRQWTPGPRSATPKRLPNSPRWRLAEVRDALHVNGTWWAGRCSYSHFN